MDLKNTSNYVENGKIKVVLNQAQIAELLELPVERVLFDQAEYEKKKPKEKGKDEPGEDPSKESFVEIKTFLTIRPDDPNFHLFHGRPFYPTHALMALINDTADLFSRIRLKNAEGFPAIVMIKEIRFHKEVRAGDRLEVKVRLITRNKSLKNLKKGGFSGVISFIDKKGDDAIVVDDIFLGVIVPTQKK